MQAACITCGLSGSSGQNLKVSEDGVWKALRRPIPHKSPYDVSRQLRILIVTLIRVFSGGVVSPRAAVDAKNAMRADLPEPKSWRPIHKLKSSMSPVA